MSRFISTRSSLQCRSHHQKLIYKFGEVKNIISNFKKFIGKDLYKNKVQELEANGTLKGKSQKKHLQVEEEGLNRKDEWGSI
jgi:hypothetical protein